MWWQHCCLPIIIHRLLLYGYSLSKHTKSFIRLQLFCKPHIQADMVGIYKDSIIAQDRNEDFEGGQDESTFSWGHFDLTSGTTSKNRCQMKDMGIFFP